jgi:DNA repair exonuclease SbcCD ATPase subunit
MEIYLRYEILVTSCFPYSDKGSIQGGKHFFEKYVKQLQQDSPACPLCQREFDEHSEVDELVHVVSELS